MTYVLSTSASIHSAISQSWAAKNKHKAIVQLFLNVHIAADGRDHERDEQTPLSWAAENGHKDVVQLLIRAEGNVDGRCHSAYNDLTPLSYAARSGHKDTAQLLIQAGAWANYHGPSQRTPLSYAAEEGHVEMVMLLLEWKLILDSIDVLLRPLVGHRELSKDDLMGCLETTPPATADEEQNRQYVLHLLRDRRVTTDLIYYLYGLLSDAGQSGLLTVQEVRRLLFIDLDSRDHEDRTPLAWAAGSDEAEAGNLVKVIDLLIKAGASAHGLDRHGKRPLIWTIEKGRMDLVKLLVQLRDVRADLTFRAYAKPLHIAAGAGQLAMVELLINLEDVEADSTDETRRTPLSWAAGEGQLDVVRLLVGREDVDPRSKDVYGTTPEQWARQNSHNAVAELLAHHTKRTGRSLGGSWFRGRK
jgi:ankyrin repeat domain-containing protein 50